MIGSIIGNWAFALLIDKYRDFTLSVRMLLALMLTFNLSILFVFKYLVFTLSNFNRLFDSDIFIPEIALPIGISFFTFQAISYVIDVYRKDGEVQRNLLNVGLYISLFPQLIAGPIVRYKTVSDQIENRKENWEDFSYGCCRFIVGFAKKMLLANTFAVLADNVFSMPESDMSTCLAWLGILAYTFQIYYDFSGYSDMAIGLGRMFGFHFLENFDHPYISKSISEFWRRWHMSLGTWFRDYVYFPLGGSRVKTKSRLVFNLFVVWFLTGVWHGANWTFLCWGLYYFAFLVMEKLTGFDDNVKKKEPLLFFGVFHHCYVILVFICGWVLFRAESLPQAAEYWKMMFGLTSIPFMNPLSVTYFQETFYYWLVAVCFATPVAGYLRKKFHDSLFLDIAYQFVYVLLLIFSISYMVKGTYNPFIYFNF